MSQLQTIKIERFITQSGQEYQSLPLSYQVFGQPIGTAPVVLINHALTGNSDVAGEKGWWTTIVGANKTIDTNKYTVLSFNIPGNGYDGFLIENYTDFTAKDIAYIFLEGLKQLNITQLFALVGGSLGGGLAWEMVAIAPNLTEHLVVIATDWKATDWLIANCQIQEQILLNSSQPVHDARLHAMLCYRTPESLNNRFGRTINEDQNVFNVESWLFHHGKKLQERFQRSAYHLMNHLLKTIDIERTQSIHQILEQLKCSIHIIGINSDLFFTSKENRKTYQLLQEHRIDFTYEEIQSIHGHDAFLIEYDQLKEFLQPIFNTISNNTNNEYYKIWREIFIKW